MTIRVPCPECHRSIALTPSGRRLWRHDGSPRDPDLKSCPGSLKPPKTGSFPTQAPTLFDDLDDLLAAEEQLPSLP